MILRKRRGWKTFGVFEMKKLSEMRHWHLFVLMQWAWRVHRECVRIACFPQVCVVLCVVSDLSNYPALSRLRHRKHRSRSLAWLPAGWVTEDVFWVLVIVCCSQRSRCSPAPHLLRIFWPTLGAKWGRQERGAHHRSVTGMTISITLASPSQPVTLSTLCIQDYFYSKTNHFKFKYAYNSRS